jgi:hypothetical protein
MIMTMAVLAIDSSSLTDLWYRTTSRLANAGDLAVELLLAAVILALGWILARAARAATHWLLRRLRFNEAVRHLGGPPLGAPSFEPASLASWAVYWSVLLFAVLVAGDALGLEVTVSVAERLREVLPRVVSATLEMVVGVAIAMGLGAVTRRIFETAGAKGSRVRGQIVTFVLSGFAILLGLEQLGLAAQFIVALGLTVGAAVGLGVALAFGLGCRELARDFIVEYLRSLDEAPRPPR